MRRCKLGDIAELTVGFVGNMTKEYAEYGIPFLRSLNIKPFMIDDSDLMYITERFNTVLKKSALHTGDIVIVRTGIPGTCCVIPEEYDNTNCADMVIVRTNEVNPYFLAGYINFWGQKQIRSQKVGAVQKHFNVASAKEMIIYIPNDQEKIATLLKSINDKIVLNNRVNATLEAMAKTLYDYWFVQFDFPDEKGRPYKTSGGKMVYNEELGREIPAGWEVGNLNVIAEYINGLACQRFRPQENEDSLPVVKIREIHEGIQADTERVSANIPDSNIIYDGDILFSWSATLEVHYWIGGKAGLNQHIFKVMPKDGFCKEYVYYQLREYVINFSKIAEARKTTMGHITQDHLDLSRIALPPRHVMSSFQKSIRPIHERMIRGAQENHRLATLRDWLLPMLMNGQVGFKRESNE